MNTLVGWVAVALLGGLGALARLWLDAAVQRRHRGELPLGTLTVNLVGSFAVGVLAGVPVGAGALFLVGTAALGSFTTFSTWMLETERLAEEGSLTLAALNLALSVVAGLAAAGAGWLVGGLAA